MKKINLLKAIALTMCLLISLTACFNSKEKDDDKDDNNTSKSASDKKQDIEFKGEDENGDVVVGNNISWPKDVPNDLKIKASITSVVKDETSGTVGITFEQLNQEDATAYIENLKKLGYETEFEGTTTTGISFSGKNADGNYAVFSYGTENKDGMLYFTSGETANAEAGTTTTAAEEIDMTDNDKWPKDFISNVPELEGKITYVRNDNDEVVTVTLEYVEKADFEKYLEVLKKNGYTSEPQIEKSTDYIDFSAYNSNGENVRAILNIRETGNLAEIYMTKASE